MAVDYPDPMAFIRDTYATEAGALERVRKAGLLRLAARGYKSIGLERTNDPQPGDVGVLERVTADGGTEVVSAIHVSDGRWATRQERGLCIDEGARSCERGGYNGQNRNRHSAYRRGDRRKRRAGSRPSYLSGPRLGGPKHRGSGLGHGRAHHGGYELGTDP